ncbi:uncharacterized protein [Watersipora subatra]|uniref:uncharacterized protein isoform X2 n=1 Tax=Watersipora subatra TaxID=2589382 RepID=UPI00355C56FE
MQHHTRVMEELEKAVPRLRSSLRCSDHPIPQHHHSTLAQATESQQNDRHCQFSMCKYKDNAQSSGGCIPVPAQRPLLSTLLHTNSETSITLKRIEMLTRGAEIYSSLIKAFDTLVLLTTNVTKLKELAEDRLAALYGYKNLWYNIEEITKMLMLLKSAHELINNCRQCSSTLKAAREQVEKFSKTEPPVRKLLAHGTELLKSLERIVETPKQPIEWLRQLTTKLHTELAFISSLSDKTSNSVARTYECYTRLEKTYDWALEVMKFISQDPMENPMTHEALELLASGLKSFMDQKTLIDDTVFDEISREARFLSNRKLAERCKVAKRRCSETRHLAKVRLEGIVRAQQAIYPTPSNSLYRQSDEPEARLSHDPQNSQSAPATPALMTKCSKRKAALKRRSQSFEDDMVDEAIGEVTAFADVQLTCDCAVEACGQNLAPSLMDTSGQTHIQTQLEEDKGKEKGCTESTQVDLYLIECDASSGDSDKCDAVYRGDKFLETAEVIIPLEQTHLNHESLIIESPSMEDGHVVFAPPELQDQQNFPISDGSQNTHDSISSSEDTSKVTFDDIILKDNAFYEEEDENNSETLRINTRPTEPNVTNLPVACKDQSKISPILSTRQQQKAMQKRKSFHGFTSALTTSWSNFTKNWKVTDELAKRHSVSEVPEHSAKEASISSSHSSDGTITERSASRLLKVQRMDKTLSLVTSSTDSLPSLPEENVIDDSILPRFGRRHQSENGWTPVPVNSHLMHRRVLPSQRCTSMADLRLTESQVKARVTLAHIMDELVQTERDYALSLRLVVENYIPELAREDVPQTLRGKRAVIFGNIEKIYEFHDRYFLEDIAKCENEPFKIGQYFLKHESQFFMYTLYNKNKPKSDSLMFEYGAAFFKEQQAILGDKMDLSSYLLKPVQRMGKYALILKQVLKECPETDPEHRELVAAEEMVRFYLQHGNDLLAMDSLQGCDVNLQEQGTLLMQNEFVVFKNKKKGTRHLFLFEHLLIIAKTKRIGAGRDEYIYKSSLKTADIGLTENVGEGGMRFGIWFRKRTGESWSFQASSIQLKNRWVTAIERLLWKQALKSRESKQSELSSMGVGHKPSLELRKSADNIQDRFIPSLNKPLDKRHSMDSLDLSEVFEEPKKRPYSVISLAPSSSSNSSAGSTGPGSRNRYSYSWMDLKSALTGKDSLKSRSLRKIYKSDSKIHRCDLENLRSSHNPSVEALHNITLRRDSKSEV